LEKLSVNGYWEERTAEVGDQTSEVPPTRKTPARQAEDRGQRTIVLNDFEFALDLLAIISYPRTAISPAQYVG